MAWLHPTTGHSREHKFLLLLGSRRQRQIDFLNVLETIMGSYYVGLPAEALFGQHPSSSSMVGTRIANARCAAIAEPEPGSRWRAGELKELTGGGYHDGKFHATTPNSFRLPIRRQVDCSSE